MLHLAEDEVDGDHQVADYHLWESPGGHRDSHLHSVLLLLDGESGGVDHPEVPHEGRLAGLPCTEQQHLVVPPHLPLVLFDLPFNL